MKNIDQLAEFLVEGSIWQSKRGKTYTVIAVSNLYVPKEKQDVLEPTVTFINADGVMFSLSIDRFLRMYSFVEVNDKMANCVENVYKCNAGELVDENELEPESFIDELESEQVKAETEQPQPETEIEQPTETKPEVEQPVEKAEVKVQTLAEQIANDRTFYVDFVSNGGNTVLNPQELSSAFVGYQSYMDSKGSLFHKIYFTPSTKIVAYTLNQTFNPEVYGSEANGYSLIHLNTGHGDFDIKWNAFGYIGYEVINGKEYLVATLADVQVEQPEVDNQGEQPEVESESETETESEVESKTEQSEVEAETVETETEQPQAEIEQPEVEVEQTEQTDEEPEITVGYHTPQPTVDLGETPDTFTVQKDGDEPRIIAHLVKNTNPLFVGIAQPLTKADEQPEVQPEVEVQTEPVQPTVTKTPEEQAMDKYFSVVEVSPEQADDIVDELTAKGVH